MRRYKDNKIYESSRHRRVPCTRKSMNFLPRGRLYTRIYWIILFICISIIIIYSQSKENSINQATTLWFTPKSTLPQRLGERTSLECEEKHIVLQCSGSGGTRETSFLLKTLLHFRQSPLHLHILADVSGNATIKLLLDTWQLPAVKYSIYILPDLHTQLEFTVMTLLSLHRLLPKYVEKVVVLHPQMRFLTDVNELFEIFDQFSASQLNLIHRYFADIMLLDLNKIRNKTDKGDDVQLANWSAVHLYFERQASHLYILSCVWNTRLDINFDYQGCLGSNIPKALFYGNNQHAFTKIQTVENAKEIIYNIINSNGEVLRTASSQCYTSIAQDISIEVPSKPDDTCVQFRYIAKLKRRTHIYFYAGDKSYTSAKDNDITIVTQFTIDRFQIFTKFVSLWEGPIVAVVHVSDDEAARLIPAIRSTKGVNKRDNIAFHIVYKREKFYPINYLRNVGLAHIVTRYTVFLDVDLVPNPGAYDYLRNLLAAKSPTAKPKDLWLIPAFETTDGSDFLPHNRSELLAAINTKKMIGYRMNRGWTLGHRPINYPYWMTATQPYRIAYQNAFEPYVVGLTSQLPLYEESLLERMADKISYTRVLYTSGFIFRVVDQAFVVHLPHPKSEGTAYWSSNRAYFRCGAILSDEFARKINFTKPTPKKN